MREYPAALGYLRRDISGERQRWHETQMRSLAKRLGYNLRKTVVFGPSTDDPEYRLRVVAANLGVVAVFVPGVDHFGGQNVPAQLVAVASVITVEPEQTYAHSVFPPHVRVITTTRGR
ncbi:hypothetical protein ACFVH4_06965 [Nocardia ignorata]|uniref:hypothetical protein n=1 Tax=Nocardia ignorata TaxID=145285 RepID=UPI00363E7E18